MMSRPWTADRQHRRGLFENHAQTRLTWPGLPPSEALRPTRICVNNGIGPRPGGVGIVLGRRGVLAVAAALVVVLAAGVVVWQAGLFSRRVSAASTPLMAIRFISDQGVILTGLGDRYQLAAEVVSPDGHRTINEVLRWRSSDPSAVSVSVGGTVTAHAETGSAVITVSAAGAAPQAAQVMVAQPAPGTVLVSTGAVLAVTAGQVTLRRTSLTSALKAGQILVSNGRPGGGLLARVVSVSVAGQTVSVATEPTSLARAFTALSIHAASAPITTSLPASAVGTLAALKLKCTLTAGYQPVSLTSWGVSVPTTITLEAVLAAQAGVVNQFQLAVRAILPVTVNAGTVTIGGAGTAQATCELPGPTFALPTPVFLGPVELTGDATPTPGVGVSFDGSAGLSLPGPVLSDTVTAFDGISYTVGRGWQPVDDNSPGHITISLGGQPAFTASVSAGFSLYVNTDFDVGGAIAGQELAGTALAFAKAEGDYTITMHPPFAQLAPGYTGPGWDTSLRLTAGPQVKTTGDLATLLSWIGVDSPKVSWIVFDRTFPVAASPAVTAAAIPGSPASRVTRLSVSVPPGYGGDKVEFIQYPSDGGPGHVIATATVTGRSATATWTHAASATGTALRALVYGPLYGTAGFPYATSGALTVPGEDLTGMTWAPAQLPLPANAMNIADTAADVFLSGVSCPAAGNCIAVGSYTNSNQNGQALIETLSHGAWTPAQAPLPANAASQQQSSLGGIACPAAGKCVATGDYTDQSGHVQALIETLSHGTWTPAQGPTLEGAGVFLGAVACAGVGNCVATGTYTNTQQFNQAVLVTLSHGTWSAVAAPLPPPSAGNSQLTAVACPALGTCVAIGGFNVADSGQGQGLIETLSQGTWTPSAAPLPADASNQDVELSGLACPASGTCIAVGAYDWTLASSGIRALIETLANGKWTPAGAPDQPGASGSAYLNGIACPSVGACVATGTYNNNPQGTIGATEPWTETLSQGTWSSDISMTIPGPGGLGPVACPVTGCVATVIYNHPFEATIETGQPRS